MNSIIFLLLILPYSATGLKLIINAPMKTDMKKDLLFIVPVGPRSLSATKVNVEHLSANYSGTVDVVLLHYDRLSSQWIDAAGAEWYQKHIQGSLDAKGGKFQLLQKYFTSNREKFDQYNWIWGIDEDFDISGIDMQSMMETATETGSQIVAPAVRFPNNKIHKDESQMQAARITERFECNHGQQKCRFQSGKDECKYSYVNFLEVMTPMFRPYALREILFACEHCIHEHSLWGVDNMWCKFVADKFDMEDDLKGCSLLDQHRVIKLVYHTLPKDYHSSKAYVDVKAHNSKY